MRLCESDPFFLTLGTPAYTAPGRVDCPWSPAGCTTLYVPQYNPEADCKPTSERIMKKLLKEALRKNLHAVGIRDNETHGCIET